MRSSKPLMQGVLAAVLALLQMACGGESTTGGRRVQALTDGVAELSGALASAESVGAAAAAIHQAFVECEAELLDKVASGELSLSAYGDLETADRMALRCFAFELGSLYAAHSLSPEASEIATVDDLLLTPFFSGAFASGDERFDTREKRVRAALGALIESAYTPGLPLGPWSSRAIWRDDYLPFHQAANDARSLPLSQPWRGALFARLRLASPEAGDAALADLVIGRGLGHVARAEIVAWLSDPSASHGDLLLQCMPEDLATEEKSDIAAVLEGVIAARDRDIASVGIGWLRVDASSVTGLQEWAGSLSREELSVFASQICAVHGLLGVRVVLPALDAVGWTDGIRQMVIALHVYAVPRTDPDIVALKDLLLATLNAWAADPTDPTRQAAAEYLLGP